MSFLFARRKALKQARTEVGSCRLDEPFELRAKVGLTDQDIFGHMTNTRYNAFALLALDTLLIRSGAVAAASRASLAFKVLSEDVVFIRMLKFPDSFRVELTLTQTEPERLTFSHAFHKKDKLMATGGITIGLIDPNGATHAICEALPDFAAAHAQL